MYYMHVHSGLDVMPLADRTDQYNNIHSWIKYVLRSPVSYFVVCYFQRKTLNTTKLLNRTVESQVSNLMLITA